MRRAAIGAFVSIAVGASCAGASDFNPLGFYVGASVGRSDVRTEIPINPPIPFDEHATGWKVMAGLRPIPVFAAELAYADFGHPTLSTNLGAFTLHADALQRAETLSGLVFVPLPLPLLDVYARAGIARLQSSGNPYLYCSPGNMCPLIPYPDLRFNRTNTDFLYGAGVQVKFSALALRLEYERINDSRGDPDLLSAGVAWTF